MHETDAEQIARANASGRVPVMFIHGLWLLPSSWDRWGRVFAAAGYAPLCPGWPDAPDTVADAYANPAVFANKTVGQVAEHYAATIGKLDKKPVLVGHSFGGLLTQILAGRGLAAASVVVDSAPLRGMLPLPISAPRSAAEVAPNPASRHRAVPLTFEQFRYAFGNAISEGEAKDLFEAFAVPAAGVPTVQAAAASLNPWTEAKVNSTNPDRGPMLIISGNNDNTVPTAISEAIFDKQRRNPRVTQFVEMPNRGHSLTIDGGWRKVADTALVFVTRYA
ncbi:alpha/beta hydrolase [Micromonospora sp. CPCC 205371]|nr:alpha/beta hydrolase [Micromonospora sp. CPCC 205371]